MRGMTRQLWRGRRGCRPEEGQYFLSARKKVPKKAGGTATLAARPAMRYSQISAFRALPCPALVFAQACQSLTAYGSCAHWARAPSRPKLRSAGAPSGLSSTLVRFAHPSGKKPFDCPFLKEGVRNVARNIVGELTHAIVRARAHSYPLSKRARLFPSAAYRRSAPPRLAIDRLKWRCLRGFGAARMISQCGKTGLIFLLGWRRAYSSSAAVDILDISVTQNASVVSNPRWHLLRAGGPGARRRSFLFN